MAQEAVVLFVDDAGVITCQRIPAPALAAATERLPIAALSPEAWTAWVRSLVQP